MNNVVDKHICIGSRYRPSWLKVVLL